MTLQSRHGHVISSSATTFSFFPPSVPSRCESLNQMITPGLMLNVGNKGGKIVTITGCVVVLVMIAIAVVILIIVIFKDVYMWGCQTSLISWFRYFLSSNNFFLDKNKTQNNIGNESIYIFYFISEKERKENEALNGSKQQARQQWNVQCGLCDLFQKAAKISTF